MSCDQWKAALVDRARAGGDNALGALLPLFTESRVQSARRPVFDSANTFSALAGTGIACPAIDAGLMGSYLSEFVDAGFLDPPPRRVVGARRSGE